MAYAWVWQIILVAAIAAATGYIGGRIAWWAFRMPARWALLITPLIAVSLHFAAVAFRVTTGTATEAMLAQSVVAMLYLAPIIAVMSLSAFFAVRARARKDEAPSAG